MSPEEQAERDQIAHALDVLACICLVELRKEESQVVLLPDGEVAEIASHWLKKAS